MKPRRWPRRPAKRFSPRSTRPMRCPAASAIPAPASASPCSAAAATPARSCSSRPTSPCTRRRRRGATPCASSTPTCRRRSPSAPKRRRRCASPFASGVSCCTTSRKSIATANGSARRRCCAGPIPNAGWCAPCEFIPLAEETGLILPIGRWVLETACRRLKAWARDRRSRDLNLSVNVSARQFQPARLRRPGRRDVARERRAGPSASCSS